MLIKPVESNLTALAVRPFLDRFDIEHDNLRILVASCWSEIPKERFNVTQLKASLKNIVKKRGLAEVVMDPSKRLMCFISDLANEAEAKIQDLEEQNTSYDVMCHQMFPKHVIPRLLSQDTKHANTMMLEKWDNVAVYSNDVVGFTKLSDRCDAHTIITMLTRLFATYERVADMYDIFPLQRQGDSFTMISGIEPNQKRCPETEVAQAALQIQKAVVGLSSDLVNDFSKEVGEYLETNGIQIRAGIANGPCISTVIQARTRPQFVVLGEVMDTVVKMESTGEPMEIQLSETSKPIIEKCTMPRFRIDSKKNTMEEGTTYWLRGIQGSTKFPIDYRLDQYMKGTKGK